MLVSKQFEDPQASYACAVCTDDTREVRYLYFHNHQEHKIYRCKTCGFMFARPMIISALADRKMDSVEDAELFNNRFLKTLYEKFIIGQEILRVRKILGKGQLSLLDVGCGTGWTTSIWRQGGFDATGIEPSPVRGKIARERYGLSIRPDYIENLNGNEKFDIIILRHIIEHLSDPYQTLLSLSTSLKPNGVMLIVVPNINCIGRYLFNTHWSWALPIHCQFFNPTALHRLVTRLGLKVLKNYQTPSPIFYPESFLRLFPNSSNVSAKLYQRLHTLALFPFAPLIILGYLMGLSDNLTVIAQGQSPVNTRS